MSVLKRSQKRRADVQSPLLPPASKRIKPSEISQPAKPKGLDFLLQNNAHPPKKLDAKLTNGISKTKSTTVDESHAVVAPDADGSDESEEEDSEEEDDEDEDDAEPPQVIEISSDEDSGDDSSSVASEEALRYAQQQSELTNGHPQDSLESPEKDAVPGAEDAHPQMNGFASHPDTGGDDDHMTFGELLRASHPNPIGVQHSLDHGESRDLAPATSGRALGAPSASSLGTVLTQALKTNDLELLESCFRVHDVESIRATIQRVQSQHIAKLLQRIAERMHRRPGRAGNLMVWVQWSLVAHGGYLATQPDLMKQLASLAKVIRERASGLQPLLHLKGKLDMLSAQLEIRRNLQATSRAYNAEDLDDEEAVLYIEDEHDNWSDDEDQMAIDMPSASRVDSPAISKKLPSKQEPKEDSEEEEESDDELPNGVGPEDEEESSADEAKDDEMLDLEAEEASSEDEEEDDGSESEQSSSMDEEDEEDENGEESDVSVQPPRPDTLSRKR